MRALPCPAPPRPPTLRHVQLGNIIQMPLETLLKELDHRQQVPRPGKKKLSVCVQGKLPCGHDQMAR